MKNKNTLTIMVLLIVVLSAITTLTGILSDEGPGVYQVESIRGETIDIYGRGLYRHMSADVAIQGIAQDYVTLIIGIPLLLLSLTGARRGSMRHRFLLAGTLGYFFVTFWFYTAMGMYNVMFLPYVALMGLSFFGLLMVLLSLGMGKIKDSFIQRAPRRFVGWLLIINAMLVGLLWLGEVVPPLIDGTIYPAGLEHYTTVIVQGFDLGLLLPLAMVSGWLLLKGKPLGYLSATAYIVFLALLMTALTAKIVAMAMNGVNVIPVVFIIPTINLITILAAIFMIRNIRTY
ncbi:MAG: hypothetical protein R6U64_09060 [Bacteroidales bacterium]